MEEIEPYLNEIRGRGTGKNAELARQELLAHGLPTNKLEDWRYADLRPLRKTAYRPLEPGRGDREIAIPEPITDWPRLIFQNGKFSESRSSDPNSSGVSIEPLGDRMAAPADGVEALNVALARQPFALGIEKGAEIEGLEICYLFDGTEEQAAYQSGLLRLAAAASLDVCLRIVGSERLGWINLINEIEAEEGARLRLFVDFDTAPGSFATITDVLRLNRKAAVEHHSIKRNAGSLRHMIRAELAGEESDLLINGAALAGSDQTLANVIAVTHSAARASSRQYFRNVVAEKGSASYQGRIEVRSGANGTDAHQSNKNLLLHRGGQAVAKPELIIDADDIQCTHGTSTGRLDEDALFYMGQRGIPERRARAILTRAFLAEIVERVSLPDFAEFIENQADPWLEEQIGSGS